MQQGVLTSTESHYKTCKISVKKTSPSLHKYKYHQYRVPNMTNTYTQCTSVKYTEIQTQHALNAGVPGAAYPMLLLLLRRSPRAAAEASSGRFAYSTHTNLLQPGAGSPASLLSALLSVVRYAESFVQFLLVLFTCASPLQSKFHLLHRSRFNSAF